MSKSARFIHCPNAKCQHHKDGAEGFRYIKKGYFKTQWNRQPVPRYQCKNCGKFFSASTMKPLVYRQKKPKVAGEVFKFYASGVSQRRLAICLGVNRKTVVRKFLMLARQARIAHEAFVAKGNLKTSWAQFDEMETYEHTKMKPLSIALAVVGKTGQIIEAQAAPMRCKGHLAKASNEKYGWRQDTRDAAREDVMLMVKKCARKDLLVVTDKKTSYIKMVRKYLPGATHERYLRKPSKLGQSRHNKDDMLFTLNYTCAKIRGDLSRMARRTWVTTKAQWALQAHLDLYIAWNNGYEIV